MKYLNSRPSEISNIGEDTVGARRHNFLTYEEQVEKKKVSAQNKEIKKTLDSLKEEIRIKRDGASVLVYEEAALTLKHGFSDLSREGLRASIKAQTDVKTYNSMVRAANKFLRIQSRVKFAKDNTNLIERIVKKYEKKTIAKREQNGLKKKWSTNNPLNSDSLTWLEENTRGIQFGNSVSDKERIYIINNLNPELELFSKLFNLDLTTIAFSFGSRGKAGSVAYYQHGIKTISVNKGNVGSLIHELAHALDYSQDMASSKISQEFRREYFQTKVKENAPRNSWNYYNNRKEIFARAFEAYCLDKGFSEFSLSGSTAFYPELDSAMVSIIEETMASVVSQAA